jgi:hypothetical protein
MRSLVLFVPAFLDALSTYAVITLGVGAEANPAVADIVNSNPAAVFPLALASAAVPAASTYVTTKLTRMLPLRLRTATTRLVTSSFYAMVMWRVAVIANNATVLLRATLF